MIYERKSKNVVPEKKREVMSTIWEATSGLGEVGPHFKTKIVPNCFF